MMNIAAYYERIGLVYDPSERPSAGLLRRIQYAHATTVPYENADIVRGIPLSLDPEDIFKKVVVNHRGGYCFELNCLFGRLLRAVGFNVKAEYFGRYLRGEASVPMRRHRILCVEADGHDWMCDVGIGNVAPRYPLLLEEGPEQTQFGETYRFRKDDFFGWVLTELHKGEWRDVFSFTEEPQLDVDFETTSFYCERHSRSPFNKTWMFSIKTETGRKTLDGNVYKVFVGDEAVEVRTLDDDSLTTVMREVFGIVF